MSKTIRDLGEIAKKKVGLDEWDAFLFESIHGGVLVTGCMATIKTRGKNKGGLKYHPKINRRQVFISSEECRG